MLWLEDKYQADIAKIGIKERLPKNTLLDPCHIYYLLSGICVLNHTSDEGEEKIIVYFKEKSLMGFLPFLLKTMLIQDSVVSASFMAEEYIIKTRSTCDVIKVDGDRFFSLLGESPNMFKVILCSMTQNYVNMIELLAEIISKSAPVRVCRIINEFTEKYEGKTVFSPYLTYYDIGIFTALHVITVTKIFKALISEKILSKKGRIIQIDKPDLITDIAEERKILFY